MVGHVALRVNGRKQIAAPPARRPCRQVAREPVKDVPDVYALLDHPVTRPLAAAQPAGMTGDRAVTAGPGGPRLDQRPKLAPADQFNPLAKTRIRPALKADVDGQPR